MATHFVPQLKDQGKGLVFGLLTGLSTGGGPSNARNEGVVSDPVGCDPL